LHIFIWLNLTILVYLIIAGLLLRNDQIFNKWKTSIQYLLLSGFLILPKFIAILMEFTGWDRQIEGGPASLSDLWGLLTDLDAPLYVFPESYSIYGTNIYDGSIITGKWFILLFILSVLYLIYQISRHLSQKTFPYIPLTLLIISLVFIILGWDGVWKRLVEKIPILGVEKYPWRFLFISLFSTIAFVVIQFNHFLTQIPEIKKHYWTRGLVLIIFFPVLLTLFTRNQYFVEIASQREDPIAGFSIRANFTKHHIPIKRNDASTINRIILSPEDGDSMELLWINSDHIDEFIIENGNIINLDYTSQGIIVELIDHQLPLVIRPRSYGILPLLSVSLVFYAFAVCLMNKKMDFWPSSLKENSEEYLVHN